MLSALALVAAFCFAGANPVLAQDKAADKPAAEAPAAAAPAASACAICPIAATIHTTRKATSIKFLTLLSR